MNKRKSQTDEPVENLAGENEGAGLCALCGRQVERRVNHHLIPKSRHANLKNKKDYTKQELRQTVPLCQPCHQQVNSLFTVKELERQYNTIQALAAHPQMATFLEWVRKKPAHFEAPNTPRQDPRGGRRR